MNAADEYRAYIDRLMKGLRRKRKGMQIADDTQADWCLRRMVELERRIAARAEFVQIEVARLQSWLAKRNKAETNKLTVLHRLLQAYAASLHDSGLLQEGDTYALPHGEMRLAQAEQRLVKNERELLAWIQARRPDLLAFNMGAMWSKLAADLAIEGERVIDKTTGCEVEGVRVQAVGPHFVITPKDAPAGHAALG